MNMSSESLLVILFVGLVAGWLAGQIVRGTGFGILGDLVVGILGAFIGSWLLPQLGIHLGTGVVSAIVNATIGAILLLLIVRLFRGGGGWGSRWGGGWGSRWAAAGVGDGNAFHVQQAKRHEARLSCGLFHVSLDDGTSAPSGPVARSNFAGAMSSSHRVYI
jgi:uncharacterized membrane protein YeaQ/YmgE (transglycosylase-associated protein family)